MTQGGWDQSAFEFAKEAYRKGDSAGVIATSLREAGYNLSRNAVLGKLFRAGIATGNTAHKKTKRTLPRPTAFKHKNAGRPKAPTPITERKDELLIQYIGPIGTFPEKHCCQYTRDKIESRDWKMCGHPVREIESRWCADHAVICYNPPHKKRNEVADL